MRAYKKQQAHVEAMYWWEPSYTATRHYRLPKKARYYSAKRTKQSKEIWARLTRPRSAAPVIRKRD